MNTLHRFNVDEFYAMAEAGIFNEDSRVELIRGRIVDMSPIGTPHAGVVNQLNTILFGPLAGRGVVSVQNPLRLDQGSEPQPDIMVLRPGLRGISMAVPTPPDVLLLIEVADSSLDDDIGIKADLYAEAGIQDYWVIDIENMLIRVHRRPVAGRYCELRQAGTKDSVEMLALPDVRFDVAAILGAV